MSKEIYLKLVKNNINKYSQKLEKTNDSTTSKDNIKH